MSDAWHHAQKRIQYGIDHLAGTLGFYGSAAMDLFFYSRMIVLVAIGRAKAFDGEGTVTPFQRSARVVQIVNTIACLATMFNPVVVGVIRRCASHSAPSRSAGCI